MTISTQLESADDATLVFILSEANSRLAAQQALATAADGRGTAVMGASTALAAAAAAIAASNLTPTGSSQLLWGAVAVTVMALTAALFALLAIRPVDFYAVGWRPAKLIENLDEANWRLAGGRRKTVEYLNTRIEHNEGVIQTNANNATAAMGILALAPLVGIAVAFTAN